MAAKRKEKPAHPVTQYAKDVIAGKIITGKEVYLGCQRHLNDLEHGHKRGIYFDEFAADHALAFFKFLKHSKGKWAKQDFELSPWQVFVVGCAFGWKRADGLRMFRTIYIEIARKNGKSTLIAGILLYLFFADGEQGAEIYTMATNLEQAKIIFEEAKRMVKASPELRKRIEVLKENMHIHRTNSKFEPLPTEPDSMDGKNPHAVGGDEMHQYKNRLMIDVMETATGAREQPMFVGITTAGSNRLSVCYEYHEYSIKILENILQDDTFLAFIASIDKDDDWADEKVWIKANPNLGISVHMDDLQRKCRKAKAMPRAQNAFRRLHCNEWTESIERWLDMDKWKACGKLILPESIEGKSCILGMDLSSKIDLSAVLAVFPPEPENKEWKILPYFFMPEENVSAKENKDRVPYRQWINEGYITATPGNIIDYEFIRCLIRDDLAKKFEVLEVAYDPYNATHLATLLGQEDGFEMVEMRQGTRTMGEPSKDFEALVIAGHLNHGNNPVLNWMASNVSVRTDANGNYMPTKPDNKAPFRIDGIVALIMALGRAMARDKEEEITGIYIL